jgi:hypothetical protein
MENSFVLIVLLFAALATGGLIINWIGLGRAMSRLSVSAYVEFHPILLRSHECPFCIHAAKRKIRILLVS